MHMGEVVSCLANVSNNYSNYLFTICNYYGSTSEKTVLELFDKLAEDIGKENVIVRPLQNGLHEFESLFNIELHAARPVLILTDKTPSNLLLLKNQGKNIKSEFIKINLGKIKDDDSVRKLLFEVVRLIKSGDFDKISMHNRMELIKRFIRENKIVGAIITLSSTLL